MAWVRLIEHFRARFAAYVADGSPRSEAERLEETLALLDEIEALDRGRAFLPGEAYRLKRFVIDRSPAAPEHKARLVAQLPPPSDFRTRRREPTPRMRAERAFVAEQVASGVAARDIEAELERRYRDQLGPDSARN